MMGSGDIEGVAKLIENTRPGWAGNPTGLRQRRLDEANMYRQRPDLVGQGGGTTEGSTLSGTTSGSEKASGSIAVADPNIQNGFIRIESRNSMHIISQQYLFLTSAKDMHRYVAGSIFDSAAQNVNRIAGGYVHESVNQEYTLSSGSSMAMFATRIDMNGTAPPLAIAAVAAIGPSEQAQADGILNSLGNVTPTLTDTIVYHLPFHEPYDDHGGRNFESLRNSTNINTDTGLRDGEVVPNSSKPLDIVGTPRSSMPAGMYMGAGYNNSNEPLYAYTGPTGNAALFPTSALQLSSSGVQFITSFENGSYRPIVVGNPPTSQIGYGHELTPTELSSGSVMINGTSKSLSQPLVQQDILDLFNQDMTAVQTWMRPVVNVAVTQTQYDMLCSLAFNIGEQNFKNSDSIKELNAGNLQKVPNLWMQHTVNGGGQLVPGLIIRRRAEVTQFMLAPKREVSASITSNISINTTSITVAPNH
jgi:lysozyme